MYPNVFSHFHIDFAELANRFVSSAGTALKPKAEGRGFESHVNLALFFSIRFLFHGHWQFTERQGKGVPHLYSSLPPAVEHSDICLQLCICDDYHAFLIAPLVTTRLLLGEIYI